MLSRNRSPVLKRGVVARGHRTSVSLEQAFWDSLKEIADECRLTVTDLIDRIEKTRETKNLSSAIRVFVLTHFRTNCSVSISAPDSSEMKTRNRFHSADKANH